MPSTVFLCTGTGDLFVESLSISTLTKKGKSYILQLVVPNKIDMIALSYVKKGSDLQMVRSVLGEHAKSIILIQGSQKLAFLWAATKSGSDGSGKRGRNVRRIRNISRP
jgi:hypothetical protein